MNELIKQKKKNPISHALASIFEFIAFMFYDKFFYLVYIIFGKCNSKQII